jgi:transcriptional regulator with XRE-family HTH domain
MNWAEELRHTLKAALDAERLKQVTVAKLAGVSQPAISQFVGIKGRTPEVPLFLAACQLLGLDPYQLVGVGTPVIRGTDDPPSLSSLETLDDKAFLRRLVSALLSVIDHPDTRHETATARPHQTGHRKRIGAHRG